MFSKRRQSKSEFFGIIRNIFSSGSKTSQKINNVSSEVEPKNSKSLKKMMKSKMSFTRMGSKRNYSPEGRSKSSITNLSFEEGDLNLSHILKESSTVNKSNAKNKRFDKDTTQQTIFEDISFMSQICDTNTNKNQTINDVDKFNESDDDYYKKMKNSLLSRNKKAPFPKPKRTKSVRKEVTDPSVPTTSTAASNIPGCSFNKVQTEGDKGFNDISYNSIHSEFLCSEIVFDTLEENDSVTELAKLKRSNKIPSLNKSKKYRFDPMARNERCGVVLLSDTIKTSSQMSWCSVSSH